MADRTRPMSEAELLSAVLELAKLMQLRTAHFRPAKTEQGWRTAVQGDGKGFPDLVIVGRRGVLYRELKADNGRSSVEQTVWLQALRDSGADAGVWFPANWRTGSIQTELAILAGRGERKGAV